MPQARIIQTNFTAGELSPRMRGRVDLAQYAAGADTLTNVLVLNTGAVTRRPGSYYVAPPKLSTARVRLVPFVSSTSAAYVLEFGNAYIRFFHNRARLVDSGGLPLELATPYATADLRDLAFSQSADVLYICHASYQPCKLSRTAASTFQFELVTFQNGPYDTENTGDAGVTGSPGVTTPEAGGTAGTVAGSGGGSGGDQIIGGPGGSEGGGDGGEGL